MMKTKLFIIILSCLIISACQNHVPKSIKKSFVYCYDDRYTGIDSLINIDGYYKEMSLHKRSPTVGGFLKDTSIYYIDTSYFYFMFYDNGLYVYSISDIYYDEYKKEWIKKDKTSFLKDFSENGETPEANYFYGNYWGSYTIHWDTIKVQRIYKGTSLNDGWAVSEHWYKVIDKNTIQRINSFNLPITMESQPVEKTENPAIFVPISTKPKSDNSWILKERWFWCNESDWEEYMIKIGKKKKR